MTGTRPERLRGLLALEVARIVDDLEQRQEFLITMWSRHRDRTPFLDTLFHRWKTVGFPDLADLDPEEVATVDTFFRKVDEFRLYLAYTQDMPTTLRERYAFALPRIRAWGELAVEALGGTPQRPEVIDAELRQGFLLAFPMPAGAGGEDGETVTADPPPPGQDGGGSKEG